MRLFDVVRPDRLPTCGLKVFSRGDAVNGKGRLDRTSLQGMGPGLVVRKALEIGKKVHVFTGAVEPGLMIPRGVEVHVISPSHVPLAEALSHSEKYLQESVACLCE